MNIYKPVRSRMPWNVSNLSNIALARILIGACPEKTKLEKTGYDGKKISDLGEFGQTVKNRARDMLVKRLKRSTYKSRGKVLPVLFECNIDYAKSVCEDAKIEGSEFQGLLKV